MKNKLNRHEILLLLIIVGIIFTAMCVLSLNMKDTNEIPAVRADEQQITQIEVVEEVVKPPHRYKATITDYITERDINLLASILWLEARGECDEGQQAVIEVIFNRVLSDRFPSTIRDVIYQKNQFSTVSMLHKARPTDKEYLNVWLVLEGYTNVLDTNVVYFSTGKINNKVYKKIGNHWFCRI